jgi:hypothetical protein
MVQRFQATSLNSSSYRECCGIDCTIGRARQCGIGSVNDHARQSAEDHFDLTFLIQASLGSIGIGEPNSDPFDRCRELAKLHPEFPSDVVPLLITDRYADDADVCRQWRSVRSVASEFHRPGQGRRQGRPLIIAPALCKIDRHDV